MTTRSFSLLMIFLGLLAQSGLAAEPAARREPIKWANIWIPESSQTDRPRVLLIGDSICNGYYNNVEKELKGQAIAAKMATSYSLADPLLIDQLKSILTQYKFAAIHINNGLHGFEYTEDEYKKQFPELLKHIRQFAPEAKLILATSTPMRNPENLQEFSPMNERVKARNAIIVDLASRAGIPVDDLYPLVENHPEYSSRDGVHYNAQGQAVQARQVAQCVLESLEK